MYTQYRCNFAGIILGAFSKGSLNQSRQGLRGIAIDNPVHIDHIFRVHFFLEDVEACYQSATSNGVVYEGRSFSSDDQNEINWTSI
jgi:hypothetical protein